MSNPFLDPERRANGERFRERTSIQGCTGVFIIVVRLSIIVGREVEDFYCLFTDWDRAVLPFLTWASGVAPHSINIPIGIPAVVVLSQTMM